jgi:hypothetical protein
MILFLGKKIFRQEYMQGKLFLSKLSRKTESFIDFFWRRVSNDPQISHSLKKIHTISKDVKTENRKNSENKFFYSLLLSEEYKRMESRFCYAIE